MKKIEVALTWLINRLITNSQGDKKKREYHQNCIRIVQNRIKAKGCSDPDDLNELKYHKLFLD